ncbi:MAG: hypothetical protein KKB51_12465 [Candidatus Riflebacteria bacterium]|nr:hypothetical protein [Candidatus Riflebacteria bacterium]
MNTRHAIKVLLVVLLAAASPSMAWGPVSHIALTYEAGVKSGFPVSQDLIGAYLAGSTEPDVGLDDGMSEDYGTYHSEDYAKAIESVAQRKKSPDREILMARAAGMRSHIAGDSAAHGKAGYAEAKLMFNGSQTGLPKHATNELVTDMIMYDRNKEALKKQSLNFIDVDTMIEVRKEFTRMTGHELANDRDKLKKELLNHKAMALTELSLAHHLSTSDPAKIDQMKAEYSDLNQGASEGNGANQAITRIAERAKPCEDLSNFKTANKGFKIKNYLENSLLAKSMQALERGALKLTKSAAIRDSLQNFAIGKVGEGRNKAFVNFGVNLLNKDLTFKQAVFLAGKATSGYPDDQSQKLACLEIEAEALKAERDKAMAAYNNRPWWKFWLIFTQSDKKKYEQLEAQYQAKLSEIENTRNQIADTEPEIPATDAAYNVAIVECAAEDPVCINVSADLAELQAKAEAAYQKYLAAAAAQDQTKIKEAAQELEDAREKLKAAAKQ